MWFLRGGNFHRHKERCEKNREGEFKSQHDCVLRGVEGIEAYPGRYYCVLCGFACVTKEQTLNHMQRVHSKAQLQRFGLDVLVKPAEQLASDYLWCYDAEEESADFPARAIDDHECSEPTCCNLYERLAACSEFIESRDRVNWASCGESDP